MAMRLGRTSPVLMATTLNKSLAVAEMGYRLATIDIGRKVGLLYPFPWGSWVPI